MNTARRCRFGNIVSAALRPIVVPAFEGSLCQERILSGTRMGQHDNRGVLGEVRFPRAASGMLIWLRVTGMR